MRRGAWTSAGKPTTSPAAYTSGTDSLPGYTLHHELVLPAVAEVVLVGGGRDPLADRDSTRQLLADLEGSARVTFFREPFEVEEDEEIVSLVSRHAGDPELGLGPDDVVFLREIPRTSTGKFLKSALREAYRGHYARG